MNQKKDKKHAKPHVLHNSGNNEWYTPNKYIERARRAMHSIDLDPASCNEANRVVQADRFFTVLNNGLDQDWSGNVWLNPPYRQPLIKQFCNKLIESYRNGDIKQAIVLVNNATETLWGQKLLACASAVCFPARRIKFWRPNEKTATPLQGQMIIYFGDNITRFSNAFVENGVIYYSHAQ